MTWSTKQLLVTRADRAERLAVLDTSGWEVVRTQSAQQLDDLLGELVAEDWSGTLLIAGGDGMLHLALNAVLQRTLRPTMTFAVLPTGTGNDFARSLGVAAGDLQAGLRVAAEGPLRTLPVPRCNGRYFVNAVTFGLPAEATHSTPEQLKDLLGSIAYSIVGVTMLLVSERQLSRLDSACGIEWEGELWGGTILNGAYTGGGNNPHPNADLFDGALYPVLYGTDEQWIHPLKPCRSLRVEFTQELTLSIDGEIVRSRQLDCSVGSVLIRCRTNRPDDRKARP
jgi:diacylglycerol kinase family enzyme